MAASLGHRAFLREVAEAVEGAEACTFPGPVVSVLLVGVYVGVPGL